MGTLLRFPRMSDPDHAEKGTPRPIRVGISSCLLGAEVRFDGGHERDAYATGTLSRYFEFAPVCPEVAIGLGTPREPTRLVRIGEDVRVRGARTSDLDVTQPLRDYGREMANRLRDISGYILKRGSPSCGMERVVASAGKTSMSDIAERYVVELMSALKRPARPKQHVNVLHHLLGYFSSKLDAGDRAEMVEIIDQYRQGLVPLVVPITLLNHHFRRHPSDYVARQHYLGPHPQELMRRNLL